MTQADKARAFANLHVRGNPVVLYNIWDAGTARTLAEAGAAALATGSASVAAAQGYADGQEIPLATVLQIVERIVATTHDLPLSVDFEGGYAQTPADLRETVAALIGTGAVGLNFEDQVVGGSGLYPTATQAARIAAIRAVADASAVPLFINARTDLFLKAKDGATHAALVPEALERAVAYAAAGASGFFVPGLTDRALIARICAGTTLPVNVMMSPAAPDVATLAAAGAARLSHGPFPYRSMMRALTAGYHEATGQNA